LKANFAGSGMSGAYPDPRMKKEAGASPQRPRGGLGGPPKRKGRGWDALKVLGGTLMDLDGSMGYGHMDRAAQGIQARNAMMAGQAEQQRRQAMMQKYTDGLSPEMAQLAQLAPDKFLESRMEQAFAEPAQKRTFEGADGFHYYEDGSRVLPNVEAPEAEAPWYITDQGVDPRYLQVQAAGRNSTTIHNNIPGQAGDPTINDFAVGAPVPAEVFEQYMGRAPSEGMGAIRAEVTEQNPFGLTEMPFEGGTEDLRLERRRSSIGQAATTVLREAERGRMLMPHMIGYRDVDENSQEIMTGAGPILAANARITASKIPGTAEYQFMKNVESARSNIGLDRLQQMRENSPTGGALGQVPVQQQLRLEQVLGALDVTMPRPVMEENLKYLHNAYLDIAFGTREERERLMRTGQWSEQDNQWVERNYHDLNWDNFGNYSNPEGSGGDLVGAKLPDGSTITEEDIQATMQATGRSRQEVESLLRKKVMK
jgi:hypothetical protein